MCRVSSYLHAPATVTQLSLRPFECQKVVSPYPECDILKPYTFTLVDMTHVFFFFFFVICFLADSFRSSCLLNGHMDRSILNIV